MVISTIVPRVVVWCITGFYFIKIGGEGAGGVGIKRYRPSIVWVLARVIERTRYTMINSFTNIIYPSRRRTYHTFTSRFFISSRSSSRPYIVLLTREENEKKRLYTISSGKVLKPVVPVLGYWGRRLLWYFRLSLWHSALFAQREYL